MYDNLVKVIRHCGDSNKSCADCPAEECPGYGEWEFAIEALATQAADAIESLSAQLEQKQKKEPYQRKRKKCCCGAARVYLYHFDGGYYLKCHGCGKRTPVMYDKNELDAVWNEIADIPKEKGE